MNELESGAQIQWRLQRRCLGFSHTLLQPYPNMRLSLARSPLWKDRIQDHRRPAKRRGWRRTESNIPRLVVPSQNLIRCPSLGRHSIINDLSGSRTIFTVLERREEKGKGHFLRIWADLIGQGEKAADIAAGEGSSNSHKTQIPCCASDGKSFLSGV